MAITKIDDLKSSKATQIRRKVFVVHGHNTPLRDAVALSLRNLGLEVVMLHEQPNEGKTIIEKLEKHSGRVGYAVVLLTFDDYGRAKETAECEQKPRARQNVVLELGLFIGLLGRQNVSAIYEDGVELPSDVHGLVYIPNDREGTWRLKLAKELKSGGISVDLNRL